MNPEREMVSTICSSRGNLRTRTHPKRGGPQMTLENSVTTPEEYIDALDEPHRSQISTLHEMIKRTAPNLEPHIRSQMIGYGTYHYRYASGREGEWFVIGLASNKASISLHVAALRDGRYLAESYADRFPKAKVGKSCVRFKKLEDLDLDAVTELIAAGDQGES